VVPETLTQLVQAQNYLYAEWYENEKKRAFRDIESYIGTHNFYIFMKGSKDKPFCKFTKRLVALMNKAGYDYGSFDVFQDQRIR
jgi:Grx4 family monothiol glutaredoxin